MARHEMNLLKRGIPLHVASYSFENEPAAQSAFIDSINEPDIRQQLHKQYTNATEQAATDMMTAYMKSAEVQVYQSEKEFDVAIQEMWSVRKSLPPDQQSSQVMIDLIEQRCVNISKRLECMYKFKIELFHVKSNAH